MKILRTMICAALLVAGLCGCDKQLIPEIDLADNLEGSWEKVYPEGVQDAALVIWTFSSINTENSDSDVFPEWFPSARGTDGSEGMMEKRSGAASSWMRLLLLF